MKNIILIKQHSCVQLGHLYEHLFLRRVNDFFYDKHLFKSLDYAAHGTTFDEGGIIVVDIELYTDEAQKWLTQIEQLSIDLSEDNENITIALLQITAEESDKLIITNKRKVVEELNVLNATPWRAIDDLDYIDSRTIRRKHTPIYLTDQPQTKPRALTITFKPNTPLNGAQAALFNLIGRLFLFTVSDRVAYTYGLYVNAMHGNPDTSSVTSTLYLPSRQTDATNINEVAQSSREAMCHILSAGIIERFVQDMAKSNYLMHSQLAPNFERTLNEVRVLMGAKGWQQIATEENILTLLKVGTIDARFGRQKYTQAVAELLLPDR